LVPVCEQAFAKLGKNKAEYLAWGWRSYCCSARNSNQIRPQKICASYSKMPSFIKRTRYLPDPKGKQLTKI